MGGLITAEELLEGWNFLEIVEARQPNKTGRPLGNYLVRWGLGGQPNWTHRGRAGLVYISQTQR